MSTKPYVHTLLPFDKFFFVTPDLHRKLLEDCLLVVFHVIFNNGNSCEISSEPFQHPVDIVAFFRSKISCYDSRKKYTKAIDELSIRTCEEGIDTCERIGKILL